MYNSGISGYLLYHKKNGVTSFGALSAVKKALLTDKAGHTGTLDKFASGLLLVLTGRALKLAPLFADCDKRYEGVIKFGEETDTLDLEGAVIAEAPLPSVKALTSVLSQFRGAIMQEPPVYSAIHVGGKRASDLVRGGETVTLQKRPIVIYGLELVSYESPFAKIRVHCSKGTYIRSLARDIALAAGSRAHLVSLNRTQIAGFCLADAITEDDLFNVYQSMHDINNIEETIRIESLIRPVDKEMFTLLNLPYCMVDEQTAQAIVHGKALAPLFAPIMRATNFADGMFGVFSESKEQFIAFVEKKREIWKYGYVYADA
ncbi:MAG: tRNA pseudouridine(55) synthase TruB [Treponema sp.]|jgi:tRNA pseudouridine55 synthase|nr:tRNA pseudouridine(55) synthase TruB [Treponema sp.]